MQSLNQGWAQFNLIEFKLLLTMTIFFHARLSVQYCTVFQEEPHLNMLINDTWLYF